MLSNLGREPPSYDMKPQQHKAELKFSCTRAVNQTQDAPVQEQMSQRVQSNIN